MDLSETARPTPTRPRPEEGRGEPRRSGLLLRLLLCGALVSCARIGEAHSQAEFVTPNGPNVQGVANMCLNGSNQMVPVGASCAAGPPSTPQLAAGENHAGEFGNNETSLSAPLTVTASSAYASGNAVGGWMTFANAVRVSGASGAPGTSGFVQSVVVGMKSLQTTQMDLLLFNSDVTGSSTCTDKSAVAIATTDVSKQLPPIHITDWTSEGTTSAGTATNLASFYALASATSLYGCLVTRGTPTYTSTTDPTVVLRVGRN